jgi:DNA-directed RNA polymerase subunit beta'
MYNKTEESNFDAIRLRLASPEQIHAWSHGEIIKPETINYRTQKPEKDGLFCEKIFGPSKDWECYCGKYRKIRYKGIICDKCGVEVTRSIVRRERMGHIDLAVPVTHIWYLRGVPSKIGLLLNLSIQNLEKVVYFANFIITEVNEKVKEETMERLKKEFKQQLKEIDNTFSQKVNQIKNVTTDPTELDSRLIQINNERDEEVSTLKEEFETSEKELKDIKPLQIISEHHYRTLSLKYGYLFEAGIGAETIRKLLERLDIEKNIQEIEKDLENAFGPKREKLIKRNKLLKSLSYNHIRPEWMILTTIPVIPPDLRPMVPLDGGRFATSDLNDLYRRVINRNNRLKRLIELNAPEVIIRNEKRMLQEAVDALIDNSARHSKTVIASTGQKRQLKSLADILKGKEGRFRKNLLGKRIDYSARSVIVVGPTLRLNQCGIPKTIALELYKPFIISRLIQHGLVHNIRSANRFIESNRSEVWDLLEEITKDSYVLLNRAPTLHRLGIQAFQPVLIEGKAIQVHPLVCKAFNADFDGDQMAVHLPLAEEAKKEAAETMLSTNNLLKPANGNPINSPDQDIVLGCYYLTTLSEEATHKIFSSPEEAIIAYNEGIIGLQTRIKVRMKDRTTDRIGLVETSVGRIFFINVLPEKVEFPNRVMDSKGLNSLVRLSLEYHGRERTVQFLDEMKRLGYRYATLSGFSWGMGDLPEIPQKRELVNLGQDQVQEIQNQYEEGLLTDNERHSKIVEIWTDIKDQIAKLCISTLNKRGSVFAMIDSGARGSPAQLTQMMGMRGLMTNPAGEIIELPVKGNFKEGFEVLEYFISTHGTRKGLSDTALRTANAGYLTRKLVDVSQDVVLRAIDCEDTEGIKITEDETSALQVSVAERIAGRFLAGPLLDAKTGEVLMKSGDLISDEKARELKKTTTLKEAHIRSILTCKLRKGLCQKCYGNDLAYGELVKIGTAVGIIAAQSIGEPGTQLTMRTFHTGGVVGTDITQGLPRVEELFEARHPKRKAFVTEFSGQVTIEQIEREIVSDEGKTVIHIPMGQKTIKVAYRKLEENIYKLLNSEGKPFKGEIFVKEGDNVEKDQVLFEDTKNNKIIALKPGVVKLEKNRIIILSEADHIAEYIIPPGYLVTVKSGDVVSAGDALTDGNLDLQQMYKYRGKTPVQKYMMREIQNIYATQAGTKLNDKHMEVIVRQMFSRASITDPGDTDLLPGEIAEIAVIEKANEHAKLEKKKTAEYQELLLGISKVSLSNNSFLSAASFQETQKVLINASITGKVDPLEGLKENVIIGRLIPAGTGYRK